MGASSGAQLDGTLVPAEEPSTASIPDSCAGAIASLFDDIISEREQVWRNSKTKSLCGFEIYHKLEPGRLFDR